MKKRIVSALCCVLLLALLPVMAFAHEVPDYDRFGSITVTMTYKSEAVPGGKLVLYRVGDVAENNGDYFFQLVDELAYLDVELIDPTSTKLTELIADAVEDSTLRGSVETIDKNGVVTFEGLKIGLYLLAQEQAAPGYNDVAPFLVGVPNNENGTYVYEVNASPKVELEPAPTTETTAPSGTTIPGKLPQTGQTNWPVPVLLLVGMLFLVAGFWLHMGGKGKKHEA